MVSADVHITRWGFSGPRVVLVHGGAKGASAGGDAHFSAQAVLADQGWQLVLPDRPGHGRSADAGRPDDFEIDGEWVADLLEDGAHLIGHSYGGLVALAAASKRPSAVLSLTLIEAAMQALTMDDPRTQKFMGEMGEAMSKATSMADLADRFSKAAGIPEEIRAERKDGEMEKVGQGLASIKLPETERVRAMVDAVAANAIPLLTVTGGWNPGIDASSEAASARADGRHVVVRSPHHFPQTFDAPAFNGLLVEFMTAAEHARIDR